MCMTVCLICKPKHEYVLHRMWMTVYFICTPNIPSTQQSGSGSGREVKKG